MSIGRGKGSIIFLTAFVVLLVIPGANAARSNGVAISSVSTLSAARTSVRRLDAFESSLGPALKDTEFATSGRRRELLDRTGWLEVEVKRVRDDISSGSGQGVVKNDLASALVDASRINRVVRNVSVGDEAMLRWGRFRLGMNSLAKTYGLRPLIVRSNVGSQR